MRFWHLEKEYKSCSCSSEGGRCVNRSAEFATDTKAFKQQEILDTTFTNLNLFDSIIR